MVERLIEELQYHNCRAGALTVHVAYKDRCAAGGEGPLEIPTDWFDLLLDATRIALRGAYIPIRTATHMHVIAPNLRRGRGEPLSLFTPPDRSGRRSPGRSG